MAENEVSPTPNLVEDMIGQEVFDTDYVVCNNLIYKVLEVRPYKGRRGSVRAILTPGSKTTRPKILFSNQIVKIDSKRVTMMILKNQLV